MHRLMCYTTGMSDTAHEISERSQQLSHYVSATYDALFDENRAYSTAALNFEKFLLPAYEDYIPQNFVDRMVLEVLNNSFQTPDYLITVDRHILHSERSSYALESFLDERNSFLQKLGLHQTLDSNILKRHPMFPRDDNNTTGLYTFYEIRTYSMFIALLTQYEAFDTTFLHMYKHVGKLIPNISKLPDVAKTRLDRAIQITMLCALADTFEVLEYDDMPMEWFIPVLTTHVIEYFEKSPLVEVFYLFPGMQRFKSVLS